MCICICVYIYIYSCMHLSLSIYIYIWCLLHHNFRPIAYLFVCYFSLFELCVVIVFCYIFTVYYMYVCVCMYIYIYIYMYVYMCIHINICIYMYVCVYIHIYIYIYIQLVIGSSCSVLYVLFIILFGVLYLLCSIVMLMPTGVAFERDGSQPCAKLSSCDCFSLFHSLGVKCASFNYTC